MFRSLLAPALVLWVLSSTALTRPVFGTVENIRIGGQSYVPLKKWADAKGFSFCWDRPAKNVILSNRWARLEFTVNSKKSVINGVAVWLSSAVNANDTAVYVAQRDFAKSVEPLLYPPKLPPAKKIKTIMLAAGHGGKDPGYQINKEQEKKYTLLMAGALQEALRAVGFKVLMTRESDTFVDLPEQAARANRANADLFITLHYNAAAEVEARGVETFCLTPEGAISTNGGTPNTRAPGHRQDSLNVLFAYHVHRSLLQNAGFEDRGIRRAAFVVLRNIEMPGVLIEGGFLSNPADAQKILNPVQRRAVARAIVDGVLSFKRLVERK